MRTEKNMTKRNAVVRHLNSLFNAFIMIGCAVWIIVHHFWITLVCGWKAILAGSVYLFLGAWFFSFLEWAPIGFLFTVVWSNGLILLVLFLIPHED